MSIRPRTPVALIAIAACALAAGCGSATNDYRGKVNDVRKKYEPQLKSLQTKIAADSSSPPALIADMRTLSTLANGFADDVAAIKVPSGKQKLADDLVAAERNIAKAASAIGTAADAKDVSALQAGLGDLETASSAESSAIAALNAAN